MARPLLSLSTNPSRDVSVRPTCPRARLPTAARRPSRPCPLRSPRRTRPDPYSTSGWNTARPWRTFSKDLESPRMPGTFRTSTTCSCDCLLWSRSPPTSTPPPRSLASLAPVEQIAKDSYLLPGINNQAPCKCTKKQRQLCLLQKKPGPS